VKKPKIKLNTSSTPKTANGAGTPKSAGGSAAKITKVKAKKPKEAKEPKEAGEKKAESSKESKMNPEERHKRRVVSFMTTRLFLRR
jgi:hypothetical protein